MIVKVLPVIGGLHPSQQTQNGCVQAAVRRPQVYSWSAVCLERRALFVLLFIYQGNPFLHCLGLLMLAKVGSGHSAEFWWCVLGIEASSCPALHFVPAKLTEVSHKKCR